MCGIFGFISTRALPADVLFSGTDVIRHRGPDGEGAVIFEESNVPPIILKGNDTPKHDGSENIPSWFPTGGAYSQSISGYVGLAHRRLSIVDLSPMGHQPMSYRNARYWITYNGEIYSHLELREELSSLGHKFASHSDTEVILAAYSEWGSDCLRHFNGMWAFAIYDLANQKLFLARDRFGVKPLYYWLSPDNVFFFGSEIKQFTVLPEWEAKVNTQRAYDFLEYGRLDHTNQTLFDGVYQLSAGHWAEVDTAALSKIPNQEVRQYKWYHLSSGNNADEYNKAVSDFQNVFLDAVRLRLRSDVPVGACLSGGLDSTSILCTAEKIIAKDAKSYKLSAFSALSHVEKYSEEKWIRSAVSDKKVDIHYTTPDLKDMLRLSEEIAWYQDEPYGSTSIFAQWSVFKLAAQNKVKVVLDGQGADEQLFGYHSSSRFYLTSLLRRGAILRFFSELSYMQRKSSIKFYFTLLFSVFGLLPKWFKKHFYLRYGTALLHKELLNSKIFGSVDTGIGLLNNSTASQYCSDMVTNINLPMLLHWEDRDSMAHAVESRVPFLDYRLVELCMNLPDHYKIDKAVTKRILRSAMSGVIPDSIRDRSDKLGFATAEEVWLRKDAPDAFRQKMRQAIDYSGGILTDKCMDYIEDVICGKQPFNFTVWRLISFGEWMKVFKVRVGK